MEFKALALVEFKALALTWVPKAEALDSKYINTLFVSRFIEERLF
jgi:hypothetical protein